MFTAFKCSTPNPSNAFTAALLVRKTYSYSTGTQSRNNLYARISPLGDPTLSIVPVLDQWVSEGRKVKELEFQRIIRDLRSRRRYSHALEISEWMSAKALCPFSLGDRAIQLDLIGKVRGLSAAENYFNNMSEQEKIDKIYGALLNCYIREGLVDESLSHIQKMKQMGFANSTLTFNNLMSLYAQTGQLEKIPDVLSDMKESGLTPNNLSYRLCINAYGTRSDLNSMEKILAEMESEPEIVMDWTTYSMVANNYIKASLPDKALIYLKKAEARLSKDIVGFNHLITLYASLGKKDEVMRFWGLLKDASKKPINRDYITMLGSLVKMGELEETEKLLEEWESSGLCYDFRLPNTLLIGYCKKGLIEKAEAYLKDIIKRGKTPIPNSWAIIAAAYMDKQNMEKAFECFKEALSVRHRNIGWRPKPVLISGILRWVCDEGEAEEVEAFVSSLKSVVPMDREMYHTLIKANIRAKKEVEGILERMVADKIDLDDETVVILGSRQEEN